VIDVSVLEGMSEAIIELANLLNQRPRPADFERRLERIARRVPKHEQMVVGDLIEADYVARSAEGDEVGN